MHGVRVLVAPGPVSADLSATRTAGALATGWSAPADGIGARVVTTLPMSDASSGLVDVLAETLGGTCAEVTVPGPMGEARRARVLHLPSSAGAGTVVVDAGEVIGDHLARTGPEAVLHGSSVGVGLLLRSALATGAGRVVVGLRPAAVHDGGAGALAGLVGTTPRESGAGRSADRLARGASGLADLGPDDLSVLGTARALLADRDLVVACSEDRALQGLHGAGADLPRRHGLDPATAQAVDRAVGAFADLVDRGPTEPHAGRTRLLVGGVGVGRDRLARRPRTGAAGGVAALLDALGGRLLDGAAVVSRLLDLPGAVARSDLVVTGTTRLDAEALHGGVVAVVAEAGLRSGVPVVAVSSRVELTRRELARLGVVGSYELDPAPGPYRPVRPPLDAPDTALESLGRRLAVTWTPREVRR